MDYQQGYDDGYNQRQADKASGRLISSLLQLTFKLTYMFIMSLPLILISHWMSNQLGIDYKSEPFIKTGLIILLSYIIYCIFYFIKGIVISLKANRRVLWIPVLIFSVLFICSLQMKFVQAEFEQWLKPITTDYELWSGLGSLLIGALLYVRYNFMKDTPYLVLWAYNLGLGISLSIKNPVDNSPNHRD